MNYYNLINSMNKGVAVSTLLTDLIAYYKLDSNSNDSTANAHNATDTSISYVAGKIGNSASFNGSTSVITIPDSTDFTFNNGTNDTPFHISFWAKSSAWSGNRGIISKGLNADDTTSEWNVFSQSGQSFFVKLKDKTTNNVYIGILFDVRPQNGGNVLTSATWYKFDITYDGSQTSAGIKMYLNNVECTNRTNFSAGTYTGMGNTTRPVTIGNNAGQFFFSGEFDEVGFWDRVLTTTERGNLYNGGTGLTYPF